MFHSGDNSRAHGQYANQIDDREPERQNSLHNPSSSIADNNNHIGSGVRGNYSIPRSDINSDYNINNQRVPMNDLELIN